MGMQYNLPQDRKWDRGDRVLVALLILSACALRLWIRVPLDNDTFFLLSHGRYVFEHGLPTVEPFTFHEGLRFVMQQWLSASVFFLIYNSFDYTGLYILAYMIYVLYGYLGYKLSMLLSHDNLPVSTTTSLAMCVGMAYFVVLRPWMFSGLIFLFEITCLELYIQKNKVTYLVYLPLLSILLINMHAAVWPFFYIILFPYILDGFKFQIQIIKSQGYPTVPIVLAGFVAAVVALLNPYSMDAITYLYYSYGNEYVNAFIVEMESPSFKDLRGFLIFALYVFLVLAYCLYQSGSSRLRHFLLTLLTAYMGLSSSRSVQYFFLTFPYLAYYYRDFDILAATNSKKTKFDGYTYAKVALLVVVYAAVLLGIPRHTEKEFFDTYVPQGPSDYILNHLDAADIRLFNDYDMGDFLEFKGIRTFIDTRAEVFLKSTNGKADILGDYVEFLMGRTHYEHFIEKYRFTHFLVFRGSLMDTYLSRDENFHRLYEDTRYRIFRQECE